MQLSAADWPIFFINKVRDIQTNITATLAGCAPVPLSFDIPAVSVLSDFVPVTSSEVQRLLTVMPSKSSPLDVIPTSLLKSCSTAFSGIIAHLANLTFQFGQFPAKFKLAQITPLLKQKGLDTAEPSSYRPISNLNTISKILERLVLTRITSHLNMSGSLDQFQSAYRSGYSTETALLKVTNDIFEAFDAGKSTILVALDLSAAFDCIGHDTLIRRLQHTYGIGGLALQWLQSYLHRRSTFVKWMGVTSQHATTHTGVPQGSSLGPQLFSMYVAPLAGLIRSFGINYHQYADDTQLYIAISKSDVSVQLATLEQCIVSVHQWLLHNGLALNPKKSDVIQFVSRRSKIDEVVSVRISDAVIKPVPAIKSLGMTLDRHLIFDQHVNNVCKACYWHIRALRHVRDSLPDDVARTVACSIVTSRLDYCNSLYTGMSSTNVQKLQRVQNTLARVVLKRRKFDHITPLLEELHWLPVKHRLTFKLATLTFKILSTGQPTYLRELIDVYDPVRTLRSSDQRQLRVVRTRTVLGSRAFRHSAAAIWNNIPVDIRTSQSVCSFRRNLKTFLFRTAFST